MRGDGMHGVVDVLHVHLPVAVDDGTNRTASHLQLPFRRAIRHIV